MKIEESQGIVFGNYGGNENNNNDGVGNGMDDRYKHDRHQLTLVPNWVEINLCWDKYHEGIASWMTGTAKSKWQDADKLWRQKIKRYLKWKKWDR